MPTPLNIRLAMKHSPHQTYKKYHSPKEKFCYKVKKYHLSSPLEEKMRYSILYIKKGGRDVMGYSTPREVTGYIVLFGTLYTAENVL